MDGSRIGIRYTSAQDRAVEIPVSARRRRRLLWLAMAALAVSLLALLIPSLSRTFSATRSVSADRLRTAVVERGTLLRDIAVQGRVVAAVSPTLFAPGGRHGHLPGPGR